MKKIIKKFTRWLIRKSPAFRSFVIRLYKSICNTKGNASKTSKTKNAKKLPINMQIDNGEEVFFNEKSMYAGYAIDYINSILLSKEERANELKRVFYNNTQYYLDLKNPKTFNQKLQWLKLNYFDPDMERCVCKYEFKKYVEEKIGPGYTLPLYGMWEDESDFSLEGLPNEFVLKSTVQSDGRHIIVVKDKNKLDLDKLKTVMSSWLLKRNTLCSSYCCAYSNLKPKIIAEQYLEGFDDALTDYKFMCFNGKAEMLFVVADRHSDMALNFYDLDWNLLPFTRKYPNSKEPLKKPKNFDKMVEIANKLAEPFPFVRVDFYESADGNDIYVGELTFYPGGGYETFEPMEWDYRLGDMLELPEANR